MDTLDGRTATRDPCACGAVGLERQRPRELS